MILWIHSGARNGQRRIIIHGEKRTNLQIEGVRNRANLILEDKEEVRKLRDALTARLEGRTNMVVEF